MSNNLGLSYSARKALSVHVGESAGNEIANLIQEAFGLDDAPIVEIEDCVQQLFAEGLVG